MGKVAYDGVWDTSTTTGTGTYTLSGTAPTGYQNFSVVGDANQCYYRAQDNTNGGWEEGLGTYTASGATLARTSIIASSNANAAVSWPAGTRQIILTAPATIDVTCFGGALTANALVLGAGGADTKVVPGVVTDGTSQLQLGVAGTSVGSVQMANATSGTITLQPVAGALGTVTLSLPAAADTLVGKATTDILTNKTLTGNVLANFTSGGKTITAPAATGTLPIIIASSGTASGTTNSASEFNLAAVKIPAGIMGTNGRLVIDALFKFVGAAGNHQPVIRHSTTSGDTSAGTLVWNPPTSNDLTYWSIRTVWNSNSASAQILPPAVDSSPGPSAPATLAGAINTANDSYINFNASVVNSGDIGQLVGYTITFYPGV